MNSPQSPQMFNVQIDGVWHQFPKGTRMIEACEQAGSYVPRYCYHKKLSSPGNCRMCLVEMGMPKMGPERKPELGPDGKPVINWMPRPQISCAQDVAEGMGVRTNSPLAKECQRGVMEFLFFFQAEDGIRCGRVTGVQTCALPISGLPDAAERLPGQLSYAHRKRVALA